MYTIISIIFTNLCGLVSGILFYLYTNKIWLSLLMMVVFFLLAVGLYSLMFSIIIIVKGKKFAKTYAPHEEARWRFMRDIANYIRFWLGIRLHVKGIEKLPKDETLVFYSNHQGFVDLFMYDVVLKDFKRGSMYKIEHMKNPFISGMVKALGGIPIDRSNDRKAVMSIMEIIKEVKSGVSFMIYPEGTRSRGKKMNDYHAGSFKVAQKAKAKLVVLALDGGYKKMCGVPFIPTHLYIEVVDVLDVDEICEVSSTELATKVQNLTQNALVAAREKYWYL